MDLQSTINTVVITVGSLTALWFLYKTKAVGVYKDAVDAYEVRLKQFESDLKNLKIENKDLNALVNQLKGENKALKDIVVKPDSEFKETVKVILQEIKIITERQVDLEQHFVQHAREDDKRFTDIGTYAKGNHEILLEMRREKDGGHQS